MPSSTFSSERVPELSFGRLWLVALLLVVVGAVGLELGWRQLGHRPSIIDDTTWWAINRQAASEPNTVVLIGASRLKLGFSSEVFRERFPDRPLVRLSIGGVAAYDTLKDLADDETFNGVVICSVAHSGDVGQTAMNEYIKAGNSRISLDRRINRTISAWLRDKVAFLGPEVGTWQVVNSLVQKEKLPDPRHVRVAFDRAGLADYSVWKGPDSPERRRQRVVRWAHKWGIDDWTEWGDRIHKQEKLVRRIQERGGQVVFLAMPMSDPFWASAKHFYPRGRYWSKFAKHTQAVTLHFKEMPVSRNLVCPDSSHLDQRDAPRFTEAVLDELVERGVFLEASPAKP